MKKLVLLFGLIVFGSQAFAFDIVYPAKNDIILNSSSTFFIGSSDKPLKINGQDVPLHPTGAFAYVVNLNNGANTFVIQSEEQREIFVITKQDIASQAVSRMVILIILQSIIHPQTPLFILKTLFPKSVFHFEIILLRQTTL